ncbi:MULTISPECIES: Tetratricopeptide TPR_4 [Streptomycetaceae]|uniref:Tetratricopeptide TPR_4 n=1 Tax=Streptantibioticus cattleyicolor (strain ATCC 35852 / DSM 46488 / JCM 4925 / NBRC 14057 / NRRL 8057) TaxID=1003195 RepID=G8WN58_STREN|nr:MULTISPECIES: Tetratricopeptide TPR_4 [Streptomycetaceae]AEW93341.1 Tetratricopeptide TPR_4 [Streptantibioticus cattleyicolor NRRL 8057 = DSM 46488]MYS58057.1 hypothetical protein [Streptomyces sp. SID5468]
MADHELGAGASAAAGSAVFVGRRRELAELHAEIDRPGLAALRGSAPAAARVLLIAGRPGSGRTTLALRLAAELAARYPDGLLFARLTGADGTPLPAARIARDLLRSWRLPPRPAPVPGLPAQAAGAPAEASRPVAAVPPARAVPAPTTTSVSAPSGPAPSSGAGDASAGLSASSGAAPRGAAASARARTAPADPSTSTGAPTARADRSASPSAEHAAPSRVSGVSMPAGAAASSGRPGASPGAAPAVPPGRPGGPTGTASAGAPGVGGASVSSGAPARAPFAGGGDVVGDPVGVLRAAVEGRRVLVVLDDVAEGGQVAEVLPGGPQALVVATSRGPLAGVADVRPCALGGLDAGAAVELITEVAGATRVTCDPAAAEALARQCEGNPTALRLLAGWMAARPGRTVGDALAEVSRVAEAETDVSPVARAFRVVYAALPGPAARLARLLAIAPDATVDDQFASALAGCAPAAAGRMLDELLTHGVVRPGPDGTRLVLGSLQPLLAAELAARERPADVTVARARMLERAVRLLRSCRGYAEPLGSPARKAAAELPKEVRFPSAEAADRWLRERFPVLLAAARIAVADGELDTLARRLAVALLRALEAHRQAADRVPELYELHGLLLTVAKRHAEPRQQAAALLELADLDARRGRSAEALRGYRAALDAARAGNDPLAQGRALEALGDGYRELGDAERAADWYGRALTLRLGRGDLAAQVRLHGRLGALATSAGRTAVALREWRSAAAVARRAGDPSGVARALAATAVVQERSGQPEEALRTGQEALHWARQAGDTRTEGTILLRMADVLDRLGDPAGARIQREAAGRLLQPHGAPPA